MSINQGCFSLEDVDTKALQSELIFLVDTLYDAHIYPRYPFLFEHELFPVLNLDDKFPKDERRPCSPY